ILYFFFSRYGRHRPLHSFPTRRSSDLLASARRNEPGDHRHRGGLAGAVRPEQPEQLPALEGERDAVHGHEIAEDLAELSCFEGRSEEHTSELQSRGHLVCRLLLEKKKT